MHLVVARIGRPHGLRGEVTLEVRTDQPERRLAVGSTLLTDPPVGPLTVTATRAAAGRWYATFAEVADRTAAEELRGVQLVVDVSDAEAEDDAWYRHELVGLRVEHVDGRRLGTVVGLEHLPAQDALVVEEPSGARSLVPFVRAIVPVVDVRGGRVVLDPPAGLLHDDGEPAEAAGGPQQGA